MILDPAQLATVEAHAEEARQDGRLPLEFRYRQNLDTPRVRRGRWIFKALFGFDPELPDEVVRTFGASYFAADPVAEAFVDEAYLRGDPALGRAMLDRALAQGIAAVPEAPASMRALFAERETPPAWLDMDQVDLGARVFRRYGPELFRFLGAITLEGYHNNSVVKPLVLTGAYAGGSTKSRFMETASFWVDVSEPGGLRPGGTGWATSMRVRVMHVFVRRRLLAHPEWRLDDWGVPISQADALITLMAGCIAPGFFLRVAGFRTSEEDIAAMMHFWRYVGHLMGVQPPWYPASVREALQFSFMAYAAGAGLAGDDGVLLCRSFNDAFRPELRPEQGLFARLRSRLEYKVHQGYVGLFVPPATRRSAGIAPAGLWTLAPVATAPLVFAAETLRRHVPAVDDAMDHLARRRRRAWLARHMGERKAEYTAVAQFTR